MGIKSRKNDHLVICLNDRVIRNRNCFDDYFFSHCALPEVDFKEIDTRVRFLGYELSCPLLISSMTGGIKFSKKINENLAKACQKKRVALALGSERILVENKKSASSFQVKKIAKNVPLIGNLGVANLNEGFGFREVNKAINVINADALFLHLNPLQEVLQEGGNVNYQGLLKKIRSLTRKIGKPILVKEIGTGISGVIARKLFRAGIKTIDVSGKGGTTWSYIESKRSDKKSLRRLGEVFSSWGIDTPRAIKDCKKVKGLEIIAGGGLRSGLDIAKSISLGADIVSIGLPFLKAATRSSGAVEELIDQYNLELKVAMFCVGAKKISDLKKTKIYQNG